MSSKLEQFIKEHRSEFNDERPSKNVWDEIEATLPQKKTARVVSINMMYKWVAAAAVVCIVLTSTYFVYLKRTDQSVAQTSTKENNAAPQNIAPEYASQINQQFKAIQTRQQELKAATADHPELYKEFLSDLQVLDSTYQMLQRQTAQTPNRDVIIKAMIQNLQLQAELLYRQLMITNEIKKDNTPGNRTNDIH
ncbi:MAG: hypothetical protein K2X48_16115 [Chitinophagaceae bacterium]|nr:hypothetical protein [Chitinophagaceae bacterium]